MRRYFHTNPDATRHAIEDTYLSESDMHKAALSQLIIGEANQMQAAAERISRIHGRNYTSTNLNDNLDRSLDQTRNCIDQWLAGMLRDIQALSASESREHYNRIIRNGKQER